MAIKSGFFHAIKTGNTYDRTYSAEDHTLFFKGTVSQNGVFRNIKGQLLATSLLEHQEAEVGDQTLNDQIRVLINPGKAMVNGYWFSSDSEESVYLNPRPLGTGYRIDMISLRWNDGDRTVSFHVTEGGITNKIRPENYPVPIGYISDPEQHLLDEGWDPKQIKLLKTGKGEEADWKWYNTDVYFEPITDSETDDQVQEIALAYVIVPANVTGEDIKIEAMQGTTKCPWISFVSGYYDDAFVAQYNDDILDWWQQIKAAGGIEPVMNKIKKRFAGDGTRSSTILFSEVPGYIYESTDDISVYYNGIYMDETKWEFAYEDDGTTKKGIKIRNGLTYIPVDNSVVLEFYKGQSINIPDATDYRY